MGVLWNHWFWITLVLVVQTESQIYKVQQEETGPVVVESFGVRQPFGFTPEHSDKRQRRRLYQPLLAPDDDGERRRRLYQTSVPGEPFDQRRRQHQPTSAAVRPLRQLFEANFLQHIVPVRLFNSFLRPVGRPNNNVIQRRVGHVASEVNDDIEDSIGDRKDDVNVRESIVPSSRKKMSISSSVSKVSARVGRISDESDSVVWTAPDESASSSLTSKNIGEKKSGEEPSRRDGRFIDAQQQSAKLIGNEKYGEPVASYNLVYRKPILQKNTAATPPILQKNTAATSSEQKPVFGFAKSFLDSLKSLAQTTASRIRYSPLLLGQTFDFFGPKKPDDKSTSEEGQVMNVTTALESGNVPEVLLQIDDLRVSGTVPQSPATKSNQNDGEIAPQNEEGSSSETRGRTLEARGRSLEARGRSLEARGRSLPIFLSEELDSRRIDEREKERREEEHKRKLDIIKHLHITKSAKEDENINDVVDAPNDPKNDATENEGEKSDEILEEIEIDTITYNPLTSSDNVRITDVGNLDSLNVFVIIAIVFSVIFFVLLTIVLLLLGVQRNSGMKKKSPDSKPEEDIISQSSYMTYSTSVSDTSVNYSQNWEKDMLEDLCSIDNDSFLTSLEAVATTTNYWD